MAGLAETIAQLRAGLPRGLGETTTPTTRLKRLDGFGNNPGALLAYHYVPADASGPMPLVVVLHGCTQTAAGYDHGSGWSMLAEQHGFAVLFPEQQRQNNPNTCFNWFSDEDTRRGSGEALSIRQMIAAMADRHEIDPARVYVTGLSAGGAMASTMLATYPDVFAGGAIIAGLPFGVAGTVPQALERMRGQGLPAGPELGRRVHAASEHPGPWPAVSVWHGTSDHTVVPANGTAVIDQWRAVHGLGSTPDVSDVVDGVPHQAWLGRDGRVAVEEYRIAGLGHGTPLATGGDEGCGTVGPHMLEAGISSTLHIARAWRLVDARAARVTRLEPEQPRPAPARRTAAPATQSVPTQVGDVIEQALRAAGLMR